VKGRVICFHPLVHKGFNTDFDSDQMVVHVSLSSEAYLLVFSHMNLLFPAIRDPIFILAQDMLMGLNVLTSGNCRDICANRYNPFHCRDFQNEKNLC
jgi:DNA-directed RNA polymerase subunit beta'